MGLPHNAPTSLNRLQNNTELGAANNVSQGQINLPTYDIQVTKTLLAGTVGFGNQLTYRVAITNNGPARTNINLADTFEPATTTLDSFTYSP